MSKGFTSSTLPDGSRLLSGPGELVVRARIEGPSLRLRLLCGPCLASVKGAPTRLLACPSCDEAAGTLNSPTLEGKLDEWLTEAADDPLRAVILLTDLKSRLRHMIRSEALVRTQASRRDARSRRKARRQNQKLGGSFTADSREAQRLSDREARIAAWRARAER